MAKLAIKFQKLFLNRLLHLIGGRGEGAGAILLVNIRLGYKLVKPI
jgi:hypothetical protein